MNRLRMRAIRAMLEPLANGHIRDGNHAIQAIAAALIELTESPHEDAVAELTEKQFREKVEETHRAAQQLAGVGEGERIAGKVSEEEAEKQRQLEQSTMEQALKRGDTVAGDLATDAAREARRS